MADKSKPHSLWNDVDFEEDSEHFNRKARMEREILMMRKHAQMD